MKEISYEQAEAIFREHSSYVYRLALFMTKSRTLADDITQETFMQVFQKFHTYDPTRPIKPWIYQITLNVIRNSVRKQKWLSFFREAPDEEGVNSVEEKIHQNELELEIWKEINNLSFKSQEIIVLHYYSGLKLNEISTVLGIPLGTCKSRLNTALASLERRLRKKDSWVILSEGDGICETH